MQVEQVENFLRVYLWNVGKCSCGKQNKHSVHHRSLVSEVMLELIGLLFKSGSILH